MSLGALAHPSPPECPKCLLLTAQGLCKDKENGHKLLQKSCSILRLGSRCIHRLLANTLEALKYLNFLWAIVAMTFTPKSSSEGAGLLRAFRSSTVCRANTAQVWQQRGSRTHQMANSVPRQHKPAHNSLGRNWAIQHLGCSQHCLSRIFWCISEFPFTQHLQQRRGHSQRLVGVSHRLQGEDGCSPAWSLPTPQPGLAQTCYPFELCFSQSASCWKSYTYLIF